jgi:two-component system sensor histidine kinase YesM
MNLRFDYEIYLSLNIPDVLWEQKIPKMSLQPIVENAICHGIEDIAEDTNIYIKGIVEQNYFLIEVSDQGKGITDNQLGLLRRNIEGEVETSGGSGNGIGLKNVQDRIRINFGEEYGINVSSKLGCYTKVSVIIPRNNT